MQGRVLVADSGAGAIGDAAGALEAAGYAVERIPRDRISSDRIEELRALGEGPDAVVFEVSSEGQGGLERLFDLPRDLPVLALLPPGCPERPSTALRLGADEALALPVDAEELCIRLARAIERRREVGGPPRGPVQIPPSLLGSGAGVRRVRERIARVAAGSVTVLITGETGTGKELVATAIHQSSPRRGKPFVKVNCAALPETLLESELFGHERGAFTGADRRRIGRFEEAHGGTLLLDEVGDMHPRTQAKVLRVLQEREFERLGGSRPIRVDVRILAATNQDLERRVAEGTFRADLFFRLNVVSVHLPPLRERPEDISLLAESFLRELNREAPIPKRGFSRAAMARLQGYPWPGNVRELRNVVQRAVLMGKGPRVEVADLGLLPEVALERTRGQEGDVRDDVVRLPQGGIDYRQVERALLVEALERAGWVQKDAAALLRMSRRRFNYRVAKLGITHPSWRRNRER
jgi:DNA-binding NtrC family response regulator